MQVPTATNETVPNETVHTLGESEVNDTGSPEEAVAVAAYEAPPTTDDDGAVDVKEIVCRPGLTENDC